MLDINNFKKINDTYGHVEGDAALVRCSEALKKIDDEQDYFIGRYGGDEFIILVIGETDKKVLEFTDIFKKDIDNSSYYCSIGYALRKDCDDDVKKMMSKSEECMYKDKEAFYKNSKFERRKI